MRATYAGLLSIALIVPTTEAAESQPDPTTLEQGKELARALNAQEIVRTAIVNTIGLRTGTKDVPQVKRDCVSNADVSFADDIFATALARTFTSQELHQTLEYVGAAKRLDPTKLAAAAKDPQARASLSPQERENLETLARYESTSAFPKLDAGAYSTLEFRRELATKYEPIVMSCIAKSDSPAVSAGAPAVQPMKFKHKCSRPATESPAAGPSGEKPKTTAPRMNPQYPPTSPDIPRGTLNPGERGTVVLELFVTEKGRVAEARVAESSGHGAVDQGAMKVTEKWRMTPGTINDKPVCMWMKFASTTIGEDP